MFHIFFIPNTSGLAVGDIWGARTCSILQTNITIWLYVRPCVVFVSLLVKAKAAKFQSRKNCRTTADEFIQCEYAYDYPMLIAPNSG